MKLNDIHTALENIVRINKTLTEGQLRLLLLSAGWEGSDITDAITMWKSGQIHVDKEEKVVSNKEESKLPEVYVSQMPTTSQESFSLVAQDKGNKNENHEALIEGQQKNSLFTGLLSLFSVRKKDALPSKEVESEYKGNSEEKKEETIIPSSFSIPHASKQTLPEDLPHNLPLRPYEGAESILSFSDYEKRFHLPKETSYIPQEQQERPKEVHVEKEADKEVSLPAKPLVVETPQEIQKGSVHAEVEEKKESAPQVILPPEIETMQVALLEKKIEEKKHEEDLLSLFSNKADVSPPQEIKKQTKPVDVDPFLVTATVMLGLVLLLLLGYMYSNGRL